MCKIGINLNAVTPEGTTLIGAMGRYRVVGGGVGDWINFNISLAAPETDNVTDVGDYELEVSVSTIASTSPWSNRVTFKVSSDCGNTPTPLTCDTWTLAKWGIISNFGTISVTYVDCEGVTQTQTSISSVPIIICAQQIITYDLGGDIPPENTPPLFVVESTADFKGLKGYLDKIGVDDCGTTRTIDTSANTGLCRTIEIPSYSMQNSEREDLYVVYIKPENYPTSTSEKVSSMLASELGDSNGTRISVCSTITPQFKYGFAGTLLVIDAIQITIGGDCTSGFAGCISVV
jgi:hypothetical protein